MENTSIVPVIGHQGPLAILPEAQAERLNELWEKRRAANTQRAYASDWRQFQVWAFGEELAPLPAAVSTIARYLAHLSMAKTRAGVPFRAVTIARRLTAISAMHKERRMPDPTRDAMIDGLMAGIRREQAARPSGAKAALLTRHIRKGLKTDPRNPIEFRNRAMLLIGFAAALRRSELAALDLEHLTFDDEGRLRIFIPASKTDQLGEGQSVWISPAGALCPVKALRAWLETSGIAAGPVFRSVDRHGNLGGRICVEAIPRIVRRCAKAAGLDPKQFSGHSLRAGHATQAALNEVSLDRIKRQGRWKSLETVMRYVREVDAATNNSSTALGL